MSNIAHLTDAQIEAAIVSHRKAFDGIRDALDLLRQSRCGTHEKYETQVILLNSDVALQLSALYDEREYRDDCRRNNRAA